MVVLQPICEAVGGTWPEDKFPDITGWGEFVRDTPLDISRLTFELKKDHPSWLLPWLKSDILTSENNGFDNIYTVRAMAEASGALQTNASKDMTDVYTRIAEARGNTINSKYAKKSQHRETGTSIAMGGTVR